jgi:hypothetical protein
MKKMISGIACLALATSLVAETKVGPGSIEADARGAFVYADDGVNDAINALGAGVNLLYTQKLRDDYTLGAGFGVGAPLLESKDNAAGNLLLIEKGTANSGTYFSFDKLHIRYQSGDEDILIGRFVADTPLAASDDHYRLNKNALQGLFATFKNKVPDTLFAAGYIQAFAGIDSYALNSDGSTSRGAFNAMSDAAFGITGATKESVEDNGVLTLAGIYSDEVRQLKAQGWVYYMPETAVSGVGEGTLSAVYLDGDYYGMAMNNGVVMALSAQVISIGFSGDFSGFSHMITGVKADITDLPIQELETTIAANSITGDGTVLNVWGAYPEYAAGSEVFLTGLGKGTAIKIEGRYDLAKNLENSKARLDILMHSADGYSATFVEGGFEYAMPDKNLLSSVTLVIGSGDDERKTLLLKTTYTF